MFIVTQISLFKCHTITIEFDYQIVTKVIHSAFLIKKIINGYFFFTPESGMSVKSKSRAGNRGNHGNRGTWEQYYEFEDGQDDYLDDVAQWSYDDDVDAACENECVTEDQLSDAMWDEENEEEEALSEREMLEIAIAESLSLAENAKAMQKVTEFGIVCPKEDRNVSKHHNEDDGASSKKLVVIEKTQEDRSGKTQMPDVNTLQVEMVPEPIPVMVMMPNEELNDEVLLEKFGSDFMPCGVFPPRFVINVTEKMKEKLKTFLYEEGIKQLDTDAYLILEKLEEESNSNMAPVK